MENDALLGDLVKSEESKSLNTVTLTEDMAYQRPERVIHTAPQLNIFQPILEREYMMSSTALTISSTATSTAAPAVLNPLLFLTSNDVLRRILTLYRYYRFKSMRIRVVMVTLPQQYGFALLTRCPYWDVAQTNLSKDNRWISKDPIILTLNNQEGYEFRLPYISPFAWLNVDDENKAMWSLWPQNLITFRTDTNVDMIYTMRTYASFEGIEVAGPIDPTADFEYRRKSKINVSGKVPKAVAQTDFKPHDSSWLSFGASAALGAAALGALAEVDQKPSSPIEGKKNVENVEAGNEESNYVAQQGFVQNVYGETSIPSKSGAGCTVDYRPPDTKIDPLLLGDEAMEHSILDMCKRPQYEASGALSEASPVRYYKACPNWGILSTDPAYSNQSSGFLAWWCQFFRRWRGSLKILIHFTCSSFISARINVTVNWGIPLPSSQAVGDFPSHILTVKGNLLHSFTVPFLYPQSWRYTMIAGDIFPTITLELLDISGSGTITPVIPYIFWMGAGDDFVFDSYQHAINWQASSTPQQERRLRKQEALEKAVAQTDVTAIFAQGKFPPLEGFTVPEVIPQTITAEELLFRWSGRGPSLAVSDARVHPYTGVSPPVYDPENVQNWDFICNMFLFNSGSVRRKLFFDPASQINTYQNGWLKSIAPGNLASTFPSVCDGMFGTAIDQLPVLDIMFPYINEILVDLNPEWATAFANFPTAIPSAFEALALIDSWVKAAPDFQLFVLQPLPRQTQWPWNAPFTSVSGRSDHATKKCVDTA